MAHGAGSERRRSYRGPVTALAIARGRRRVAYTVVEDLSEQGARLAGVAVAGVGEDVEITVRIPDGPELALEARVVRIDVAARTWALRFRHVPAAAAATIRDLAGAIEEVVPGPVPLPRGGAQHGPSSAPGPGPRLRHASGRTVVISSLREADAGLAGTEGVRAVIVFCRPAVDGRALAVQLLDRHPRVHRVTVVRRGRSPERIDRGARREPLELGEPVDPGEAAGPAGPCEAAELAGPCEAAGPAGPCEAARSPGSRGAAASSEAPADPARRPRRVARPARGERAAERAAARPAALQVAPTASLRMTQTLSCRGRR